VTFQSDCLSDFASDLRNRQAIRERQRKLRSCCDGFCGSETCETCHPENLEDDDE